MPVKTQSNSDDSQKEQLLQIAKLIIALISRANPTLQAHLERVANLCAAFCEAAGILAESERQQVFLAGLLHDIGLVSVPDLRALAQPATDEQGQLLKKHPLAGAEILSAYPGFDSILPLIRQHHEALDGSGYPVGRKGDALSQAARVIQLAEHFEESISSGFSAAPLSRADAIEALQAQSGLKFDSGLTAKFIAYLKTAPENPEDFLLKKDTAATKQIFGDVLQQLSAGKIAPPAMPQVVQEVRMAIKRSDSSVKDVAEIIERDPVISLRLVAVARSPVYKGAGDINSVPAAIPRLGLKETLSVVVAIANKSLYEAKNPSFRVLLDRMWVHSVACAYASKLLAQALFMDEPETVFLMGLVHDVGKAILLRAFADMPASKSLKEDAVIAAIQDAHQSVGRMLVKRWGFGEEFNKIIALHEAEELSADTIKEVLIVHLANRLTRKLGLSLFAWDERDLAELPSARILDASAGMIARVEEKTKAAVEDIASLF